MKRSVSSGLWGLVLLAAGCFAADATRPYENTLTRIRKPKPLLTDHPEWVEPIRETNRWEARLS